MLTLDWSIVALGCLGGVIPDAIRIINGRYKTELPDYLGSVNFWLGFGLLVGLGGLAAYLGEAKAVKEALAFGFAAPELVSRLLSSSQQDRALSQPGPRQWWTL